MSRISPADALGYVRDEIAYLRQRESELKARVISEGARAGENYAAELHEVRRKVFRFDRLPHAVLSDPRYWDERLSIEVRVLEKADGNLAHEVGKLAG